MRYKDLTGQRFGRGVVIEQNGFRTIGIKNPRTYPVWSLLCDCGNKYEVSGLQLYSKTTNSCGCLRRNSLIGCKFGFGTVLKFKGHRSKGQTSKRECVVWELKCDCGNLYEAITEDLSSGYVKSCGCLKYTFQQIPENCTNFIQSPKSYFRKLKSGAKKRNIQFDITVKDIINLIELQNFKCKLTGVTINYSTGSIDRIDNKLGYTINNIHWTHRVINYMKNTLSQEEFISWCYKVCEFHSKL
mgnify:CR=1 FL=1